MRGSTEIPSWRWWLFSPSSRFSRHHGGALCREEFQAGQGNSAPGDAADGSTGDRSVSRRYGRRVRRQEKRVQKQRERIILSRFRFLSTVSRKAAKMASANVNATCVSPGQSICEAGRAFGHAMDICKLRRAKPQSLPRHLMGRRWPRLRRSRKTSMISMPKPPQWPLTGRGMRIRLALHSRKRGSPGFSLAMDQLIEAERPHGDAHGLPMPMWQAAGR